MDKTAMSKVKHQLLFKIFLVFAFLFFFGIAVYPIVIDSLNEQLDTLIMKEHQKRANREYQELLKADHERETLAQRQKEYALKDPFSQESLNEVARKVQSVDFYTKHTIGIIYAPSIGVSLPIFDSIKEEFLTKGASWMLFTDYPTGGKSRHSVITTHTGLPSATLFSHLDNMKEGDVFIVDLGQKNYLAYEVFRIRVVEPHDLSPIQMEEGEDLMSLLTCTPYMVNTHRLIVTGKRTPFTPTMQTQIEKVIANKSWRRWLIWSGVAFVVLLAISYLVYLIRRFLIRKKKYDLCLKVLDEQGHFPLDEVVFGLFDKAGTAKITRRGEHILAVPDEYGQIVIKNLPGYKYSLRPLQLPQTHYTLPELRVYVKKKNNAHFHIYPKKRWWKKIAFIQNVNKFTHIYLARKTQKRQVRK
jgi:sortase A